MSSRGDPERIVDRIVGEAGVPGIVDALEGLAATDLQSLLIEVFRRRAEKGNVSGLVERYRKNRFTKPSGHDPRDFVALDRVAYEALPGGFEALELAPVAPFGATAIVTGTSQNRIVSTIRNTEVAADSTNALALECALRRMALLQRDPRSREPVKLAASQRLMRAQALVEENHTAHFRLFGLCSAGRDTGSFSFELENLREHAGFHLALLEGWRDLGGRIGAIRVPVTSLEDGPRAADVEEQVLAPLAARHPDVDLAIDSERQQGRGYYQKLCFHVYADAESGGTFQLTDGGFTSWTQQLVGSEKERLMISGIGSEAVVGLFGPERAS
jgi:hypothetical protein